MKRSFLICFLFLVSLVLVLYSCSKREKHNEISESITLARGEIVTKESFSYVGFGTVYHTNLFFQLNASSPREPLADLKTEKPGPISLKAVRPVYQSNGEGMALVVGSDVYLRYIKEDGPRWCQERPSTHPAASMFLRTFLKPGDLQINARNHRQRPVLRWMDFDRPHVTYKFESLDLDQNIFVTRYDSKNGLFPEYLIYSAGKYGLSYKFDIEQTRKANNLRSPDLGYIVDFSVFTYPGSLYLGWGKKREDMLSIAGAKEIHAASLALQSTAWIGTKCKLTIPTGNTLDQHYEVIFGFDDPQPDYLSVFFRTHPNWPNWHFVKTNNWICADATGFEGGLSRFVFIRIRSEQTE